MTFTEVSHDIKIIVKPVFIENESDIIRKKYVYVYFIKIENIGTEQVQLLRRHWKIQDSNGESHEVDGDGVIGRQPVISPGKSHSYNSYCVLKSMSGSMKGHYEMKRADGRILQVKIPEFLLRSHLLN
jgi:ApaG protein